MTAVTQDLAQSSRDRLIGFALVLISAITFSAKSIFVKLAYRYQVDAVTLLSLRMAFSVPFFLAAAWSGGRGEAEPLSARRWGEIFVLALLGYYFAALFDFLGLEEISAGLERLVLFLYPTLVVLITALAFRRPVRLHEWSAIALSYGGIALVFMSDPGAGQGNVVLGCALVFIAGLSYALFLVGSGELIRHVGSARFTGYTMLIACAAVLVQFALTRPLGALNQPAPVLALAAAIGLFSTVLPAFALSAGIRRIGARATASIGSIGPVSTIVLAAVFLGEPLTGAQIAGTVLVLAGVLSVTLRR